MKMLPRQTMYLLLITTFLSICVLFFSFWVIIPAGKVYRKERDMSHKARMELREYQAVYDQRAGELSDLKQKHAFILRAFSKKFDTKSFIEKNSQYFQDLNLTKLQASGTQTLYDTYEINATSKISTPLAFYKFLDNIDKQGWIIRINFPINFTKEGASINLRFTMQVYHLTSWEKIDKVLKSS
jgi:hypothetical protein